MKVFSKHIIIALTIICIILASGLGWTIINYSLTINQKDSIISEKDREIDALNAQVLELNEQVDKLQKWLKENVTELKQKIKQLEEQSIQFQKRILGLQGHVNSLMAPKLIKIDLKAEDNRPETGTPYLHVYGYICNVGTYTAINSTLHVVAIQSNGVIAVDTRIELGSIDGETWKHIDSNIYYSGSKLVNWTLTLEWISPPIPV
ncbi:MAG: hypothetical protein QXG36_02600 [Nitrososphaeria archaeon]